MEYRRRRSRRRARGAYRSAQYSRQSGEGGIIGAVLLLLMTAALVYVLVVTPIGAAIVGKVFKHSAAASPSPSELPAQQGADGTAQPQGAPSPAPEVRTEEFDLPPLELFGLQLGVYDSAANAQGMISSLRSLGAAGYALSTDEGVRILASCYTTEAAANSVCKRLTEQGYAGVVYPIKCSGAVIRSQADERRLSAIGASVQLAKSLIDRLNDEAIRFDSEERSVEYASAIANEMLEKIRSCRAALSEMEDDTGALGLIEEHFVELTGCFTRFISAVSENRVETSGSLKHLQLEVIDRYCALCSRLGGL